MKTILIAIATLFLFAAQARSAEPVLSRTSYGKITFGIRLENAEVILNEKAKSVTPDEACMFVAFAAYPKATFMVEEGIITRADVGKDVPNILGISVGTPFSEVKKKYPKAIIEPHQYDPQGHYIIFKSKDGKNAIVMEEGEGKISDIRGGLEPSVEYVEGCL